MHAATGDYNNASEVAREALRLLQLRELRLPALDAVLAQAEGEAERGEGADGDAVFDRLELKYCDGFPLVPRYELRGVRRLCHGDDLIFYCVREHQVEVLHILNGA